MMWYLLWKECFHSKNVSCAQFSAWNISSPNSLKMWKLCEHIYFIYWQCVYNYKQCHVVLSFTIWFFVVFTISASNILLFMWKTTKSVLTHNYNNKQYNSVLKGAWEHITKIQSLHNSVEMLFFIWIWWLCSGVQTTSSNPTKH